MRPFRLLFYNWLLRPIPFECFMVFKIRYLQWSGVQIPTDVILQPNVSFKGDGTITIGHNSVLCEGVVFESIQGSIDIGCHSEINFGTLIAANFGSQVSIGHHVRIGHNCSIKGSTHEICLNGDSIAGRSLYLNICIGNGSWLGAGVIVLPSVTIGRKNVIAAGAVVTKDTEDAVLMAGVPAQIKKRYAMEGDQLIRRGCETNNSVLS